MSEASTIVVIALDSALLRSMAFALQAHGYNVQQYHSWKAAEPTACQAFCLVVDGCLPTADLQACLALLAHGTAVVLLAEDDTAHMTRPGLQVLHKPLSGADLISTLAALRRTP